MDSVSASLVLPDPAEHPGAAVVIYDGQCEFCTAQVRRLCRWDGAARLAYLSLHDERVAELCPDLSQDQLMQQMYVILPDGSAYGGAAAVRYLTRRLPRLWPFAPWLHIPGTLPVWQWLYRGIARRRYGLAGRRACPAGSCKMHGR
jgi:predicted DCC family thiol-disulfide oxidoreductase YuxK